MQACCANTEVTLDIKICIKNAMSRDENTESNRNECLSCNKVNKIRHYLHCLLNYTLPMPTPLRRGEEEISSDIEA